MSDISKIKLPSGSVYDIKDATARDLIAGGIRFIIAWDGTDTPVVANIPKGVVVNYSGTDYTGTLETTDTSAGEFYLVKSSTTPSTQTIDVYDEYVVVRPDADDSSTWFWEKIGDTQINLSDVVTGVVLNKQTDTVIGSDSTFSVTQPTIALETGASSGTGVISVATGISTATAAGDEVTVITGYDNPTSQSVLTGVQVTTQPTVTLAQNDSTATGRVGVLTAASATTTNIKATAESGGVAWNSKDQVTAVTGYASPTSENFVKGVSKTVKSLTTTSIKGVAGSTTASKANAATSQTTATGSTTASAVNTDILKGASVTNEVLSLGAATLNTQTTTQQTFSDVTVPIEAAATIVATGKVAASDTNGDSVVTDTSASSSGSALTGLGTPSTDTVIGSDSTFTVTQPTINLQSNAQTGTGVISVATGVSGTTKYIGATASGTAVGANGTADVITGLGTASTDTVLGSSSTITVTPITTNVKATASGGNTSWNNKDEVTALTNSTTLTVTKGNQ